MSQGDPPHPQNAGSSRPLDTTANTGYTFTDDPWIRWRNTWRYITGGLTEEGVKQYQQGRDARMEESDCRRCEQERDYLLQYSTNISESNDHRIKPCWDQLGPIIRFMSQKIEALGGDLHSGNIICARCTEARSGGIDPNYGIQLCANRGEFEDTLAHGEPHVIPEKPLLEYWEPP